MSARDTQRRAALLDATAELILRWGVRRTSVDEIAREAGVSKGAVYLEFRTKAALVDAAVRREFIGYLTEACASIEADPEGGRLSGIYRHSIATLLNRPFMRAIYQDSGQIISGVLRGPERYSPRVLLGADFLRKMADAGLVRPDIDPALSSHLLAILSLGPLLAEPVLRDKNAPSLEGTFELLAQLVVTGLEPASPSDPAAGVEAFREFAEAIAEAIADDPQPDL